MLFYLFLVLIPDPQAVFFGPTVCPTVCPFMHLPASISVYCPVSMIDVIGLIDKRYERTQERKVL